MPVLAKHKSVIHTSSPERSHIKAIRFFKEKLLYANEFNLYLDNKRINLINSPRNDDGFLVINDILPSTKSFYLSTNIGAFKNYKRIFNKAEVKYIAEAKKKIFLASELGIFETEKSKKDEFFFDHEWKLMSNSPRKARFISLNKSTSNLEFVSSDNGFYYYNPHKKKWLNRSHGLERDFQDEFGLGRFIVLRDGKKESIILPSNAGLYISHDQGLSWQKQSQGLKSNPDGFYTLREAVLSKDKRSLYLITSNGLYLSDLNLDSLNWQKIKINSAQKNENFNEDYHSISLDQEGDLLIGDSQGNIHKLVEIDTKSSRRNIKQREEKLAKQEENKKPSKQNTKALYQAQELNAYNLHSRINRIIAEEPAIVEVHEAALKFAGIPTGKDFKKYKRQAKLRNILPNFEIFMEKDQADVLSLETDGTEDFNTNNGNLDSRFQRVNLDRDDRGSNAGMRFSWNLGRLFYDDEVNDLNTNARITANIRENILTELTQIYFSRKELLIEFLEEKLTEPQKQFIKKKLEIEQYTAQIDARTGGWFSKQLSKNKFI